MKSELPLCKHRRMGRRTAAALAAAALMFPLHAGADTFDNLDVKFRGAGWFKSGMIMQSSDTVTGSVQNNYNGNWLQDAGALLTGVVNLSENFEGAFGVGAIQKHAAQGVLDQARFVKLGMNIFLTQSRFTWFPEGKQDFNHKVTLGWFPYKYDHNIKNLGLYLIRGPVYPGILFSGFESKEMLNTANMLGGHVQNKFGPYTQDLLLSSEVDLKPLFDFSFLYVGTLKLGSAFEIGGGANFYHYLPVRPGLTSPSEEKGFNPNVKEQGNFQEHPNDYLYAVPLDSAGTQFQWVTHKGIKVMGRFALDPKALFDGAGSLGPNDLKLYGEVGILGTKNYPGVYDKVAERMPMMLGFNLPAFGLLDNLSFEVEYYNSEVVPDYRKIVERSSAIPQTPYINRGPSNPEPYRVHADDWKWSLYFNKVMAGHVKLSGQLANDHFRTGGTAGFPSYEEAMTALYDWYWMLKLSYFF